MQKQLHPRIHLQPRWGSDPPGWAIDNFSLACIWKKFLFCSSQRDADQQESSLKINAQCMLTHSNSFSTAESGIPWPTILTNPCWVKLSSSSDASFCLSWLLPLLKEDRSSAGKVILSGRILVTVKQIQQCKKPSPRAFHSASG